MNTDEEETLIDLSCIVKFIYIRLLTRGMNPVAAVFKIVRSVVIGFTYKINSVSTANRYAGDLRHNRNESLKK